MTAALPSLPPRLTPRAKRTLILQSKPPRLVISSAATVTETASRKAKWPAASVRLVTRESSVRRPKLDEAAFPRSSASSYSSLYWLLLLLFSLKGTDHEEECVSAPWLNIKVIFCRVLSNCVWPVWRSEMWLVDVVWTGEPGRPSEADPWRKKLWWPTWVCRVTTTIQTPRWNFNLI